MESSTKIGLGIFVIILVAGLLLVNGGDATENIDSGNYREIVIDAKRFEFSQKVIEIKKGENVRIKVNNLDTGHGIYVPGLNLQGRDKIEFTADQVGEFDFVCATMCGSGHHDMRGKIRVS